MRLAFSARPQVAIRQRPWASLGATERAAAAELGWANAEHWDGGMETAARPPPLVPVGTLLYGEKGY